MRRQRNMAQMKEQNKTPEKELNKMEISNLSDAEFKTLVIRMLKTSVVSGYFNNIKKTQGEMKTILSEFFLKKLQGINNEVVETENQINDLEHKKEKISEQQEEKRIPKK